MHSSTQNDDVSLVQNFHKHLPNELCKTFVIDQGKYKKMGKWNNVDITWLPY